MCSPVATARVAAHPAHVLCCDNCHPELLDCTRPEHPPKAKQRHTPKKGEFDEHTRDLLEIWRDALYNMAFADSFLPPSSVLHNDIIELLACYGRLEYAELEVLLNLRWLWWTTHGLALHEFFETLPERVVKDRPSKSDGAQKARDGQQGVHFDDSEGNDLVPAFPPSLVPATAEVALEDVPAPAPAHEFTFSQVSFSGTKMVTEKVKQLRSSSSKTLAKAKKARLDLETAAEPTDAPADPEGLAAAEASSGRDVDCRLFDFC
ncbi:hypothetical protein PsYK624_171470 [Phanerochaete sordida]|uniref:Uncharacterized protein n=1 Tax=Phanerochaete sordida TaxID=48140 RepID=A0A9P3GUU7_9APHY|nr:hypothetical protein PsYK624_171470 [Phanerochaete sordida]